MKTSFVAHHEITRKWFLIDAEGQILGRLAAQVASILRGKNKPEYVPHQDAGDHVIVINAQKIGVTGNKVKGKIYYRHTGFPGGLKTNSFEQLLKRHPTFPIEKAVRGMLPKGPLGRAMLGKLKVYAGPAHKNAAQKPIVFGKKTPAAVVETQKEHING